MEEKNFILSCLVEPKERKPFKLYYMLKGCFTMQRDLADKMTRDECMQVQEFYSSDLDLQIEEF